MVQRRYIATWFLATSWVVTHAAPIKFVDVSENSGLDFQHAATIDHQSGPMSGGGAIGDFNNDGYPDLIVLGSGGRADALYINNQDGTFTDQASAWQIEDAHRGVGATVADYDGDGDDDIFITSYGAIDEIAAAGRHRLYENQGDHFINVADHAGVAFSTTTHPDGYGASFGDYDLDGDLDLFVGSWHNAIALGSRLFQNQGDGTFVNVTQKAGVFDTPTRAFGAVWADMDGDRYPELLVAGDFGTNRYYHNLANGKFSALDPGTGLSKTTTMIQQKNWSIGNAYNAMGTTVGDFNQDGRLDWFITAIWPTANFDSDFWGNGLYLNQGQNIFTENAQSAGVDDGGWGWGTEAADFDNDGHVDLIMTNGWPHDDIVTGASFNNERAYLWRNRHDGSFDEIGQAAGLDHMGQGRTLLTLDFDRDGDLDVAILSYLEPLRLYRNDLIHAQSQPADANWLQLNLETQHNPQLAPQGIGATVHVTVDNEQRTYQVTSGGTYLGQSELITQIGLGSAAAVDKLTIEWANGQRQRVRLQHINQRVTVQARYLIMPTPNMEIHRRK